MSTQPASASWASARWTGRYTPSPLYVSGAAIAGKAVRNVVLVATMHNSVYAFDASSACSTQPVWQANLGPSLPTQVVRLRDISPEVGILSTPVIGLSTNTIYVVAETYESGAPIFRLHALDLSDGSEKLGGPVIIQATVSGNGAASEDARIALNPAQHIQRPGLLLANNSIYIAFGSFVIVTPITGGFSPTTPVP